MNTLLQQLLEWAVTVSVDFSWDGFFAAVLDFLGRVLGILLDIILA